jgi:hypothetical protein
MTPQDEWMTATLAVFVIESGLMRFWNRLYYILGVPLFVFRVEHPGGLQGLSTADLQQRTRNSNFYFQFRRLGPSLIVFRERTLWNFIWPAMFGVIRHRPEEETVVVSAKTMWYTIPGVIAAALWVRGQPMLIFVPLLVFGFVYAYHWRWRWYRRVAATISEDAASAPVGRRDPQPAER